MSDYDDYYDGSDEIDDDEPGFGDEYYNKIEFQLERDNGALFVIRTEVNGVKRPGQDWGEADFSEHRLPRLASEWKPLPHAALEVIGRKLKDGQSLEIDSDMVDHAEQVVSRWLAWKKVQA